MTGTTDPALTLSDLLARGARSHPDRPALSDGVRSLDYGELLLAADRVAARLAVRGVGPGDRVAVLGPRDARVVTLLYGVLRAGAAAVVVDPSWSGPDVRGRLEATGVRHVLSADPDHTAPAGHRSEVVDPAALPAPGRVWAGGEPPHRVRASDPAYLSFTSGSSGEPKAVTVTHANTVHYALSLRDRLGLTRTDAPCVAHVTTLAADLGHTSWLLALATGGSVHVVPDDRTRDPEAFWEALAAAGVSVLKTTPSHLTALLEGRPRRAPRLHTLLLGGEALPRPLAAGLLDRGVAARVVNHYGPTEATIGASCFVASSATDLPVDEATVPIGTAIGRNVLHLVDAEGRPVPDGVDGELLIGGPGVTAGYFGRPEETARGFLPGEDGPRYRTGDRCRRREDGGLVFSGRADRQVKIRGYRVDPADVEQVMDGFAGVARSSVVVRRTPAGAQLLAAVRPTDPGGDPGALLTSLDSYLRDRLPAYSVPRPVVVVPEFPTGPNGKLDRDALSALVDRALERGGDPGTGSAGGSSDGGSDPAPDADPLVTTIRDLWASALGLPLVAPHADVVELGGDSILAMRTVTALRRAGYRVAFEDFYLNPTPALLAASATPVAPDPEPAPATGTDTAGRLAPAQRWLFRQPLRDTRHWNQSVVLRCGVRVDPAALSSAVVRVLDRHTALRRPVGAGGPGVPRPAAEVDAVTFSSLPRDPGEVAEAVEETCSELHRALDPESGRLVRVHLFSGADSVAGSGRAARAGGAHDPGGAHGSAGTPGSAREVGPPGTLGAPEACATTGTDDRLAVIAHHLAVDGLSWRILLDDLAHAYRSALTGTPAPMPATADFYRWAATTAPPTPRTAARNLRPPASPDGVPAALTWALDEDATARLVGRHGRSQRLEAFLLTAFADAALRRSGHPDLTVEVETHGRDTTARGDAYMDTVGWFTAVKHLTLPASEASGPAADTGASGSVDVRTVVRTVSAETTTRVERLVRETPQMPMDTDAPRPDTGFNFLGTFELPDEPSLAWTVAPESAGAARCPGADPHHRLRLTARIVEGRLVADLVYARPRTSHEEAHAVLGEFGATVSAEVGSAPAPPRESAVSTSGQLLLTGAAAPRTARLGVREPVRALLTGATGYLGRHLLNALLERGARVTCLVRGRDDADAAARLSGTSDHGPNPRSGRFDVVAGDIGAAGLGLSERGLDRVRDVRAVVHAAADVRLVAPPGDLERTNVEGVRRLLAWIDAEVPGARLHHLSTLAVAGGVDGVPRRFSEADLRIGQRFRTPYERTKFAAEEEVRAWAASGRPCFVHRSGHVAAHSRTGAFQRNVEDNRIYQLVRGYVLARAAPSRPAESFAFSHVDTVAAGIAAMVSHAHAAPGVYHVESPYTVPHDELVDWLVGLGHPVRLTDDHGFAEALSRVERDHPTAARLASAWSQLGSRNVVVDSSHTTSALERVGVRFAPPTRAWWSAAMAWATDAGFLPAPPR
ncbi:AMP-binding protein [Nocardiopsis sp. NPDC006938]|uniref:AMP-binding protein n=1 Tax=Nocardiopsis sp. NPDC006938 TaxID=3364337 RepID=UPI0036CEC2B5